MPLTVDEVCALIDAARAKPKEQALILLLRYSGLAILDTADPRVVGSAIYRRGHPEPGLDR